jgi:ABC-2 type transport system ATP-binding protein
MQRRLGEFSKGMRQRAKLAQAMAHDPEVIFLDEPLTGCDPMARVRILAVISDLAAQGRCVIVSSHVLHEIETMTSQILLIHKGQLRAEGDVHQIRALIDAHPHQVRVECDRPRALGRVLIEAAHVVAVSVDGDALVVDTRKPDELYPAIPAAAKEAGVYIRALTSPDDNMAAVFKYLTETAS